MEQHGPSCSLLLALVALVTGVINVHAASPHPSEPGRIDLLYGDRGTGVSALPGLANENGIATQEGYTSGVHADTNGVLAGGRICERDLASDVIECHAIIAKLSAEGKADTRFGEGKGFIDISGGAPVSKMLDVDVRFAATTSDGGWASWATSPGTRLRLVKFDARGVYEPGYDPGVLLFPLERASMNAGLHLTSDSQPRLLAVLHHAPFVAADAEIRVLAIDPSNSRVDTSYGDNGMVSVPVGVSMLVRGTLLLPDETVLVLLSDGTDSILVSVAPAGSGPGAIGVQGILDLDNLFGNGSHFPEPTGEFIDAAGIGLDSSERILLGGSVCCDAGDYRLFSVALDAGGEPAEDYGPGETGIWLSEFGSSLLIADAFTVDTASGDAALLYSDFNSADAGDALIRLRAGGMSDSRFNTPVTDLRFIDGTPVVAFQAAFDADGGVLLPVSEWNNVAFPGIRNGFGVARLLGPEDVRDYALEPAPFEGQTADKVDVLSQHAFEAVDIIGRNVAVPFEVVGENSWASVPGQPFLHGGVLPLGVPLVINHLTASTPDTHKETTLIAGGVSAVFATYTGEIEPEPGEPADPVDPNDPTGPADPADDAPGSDDDRDDESGGGGGGAAVPLLALLALTRLRQRFRKTS